jgi:8-amino-7-oxononanoate synthase
MDGDCPNLEELVRFQMTPLLSFKLMKHMLWVFFLLKGEGFVQMLGLQDRVFCSF